MRERRTDRPTPEQKALVEALREADRRADRRSASAPADLWPAVRERVGRRTPDETRAIGARASEDRAADGPRTRRPLLVPNRPLGWALAVLSVLIVGAGAYAASGPLREVFRDGLPGSVGTGSGEATNPGRPGGPGVEALVDGLFRSEVPLGGEELRQTESAGGARVTLLRAYADADSVVVGFTFEDLEGGRRLGGRPARLLPGYDMGSFGVRLADESGTEFGFVSGGGQEASGTKPQAQTVVFEPEGGIRPDGGHRFRLEIPLIEVPAVPPGVDSDEFRRVGEPVVLGFEAPVRPVRVFEVDRKATAGGITLRLDRAIDSPGQPAAVVCLEAEDDVRGWLPIGEGLGHEAFSPVAGGGDCLRVLLRHPLDGRSSVTVERIHINPLEGEVIRGPWRFDFDVPDP